MKIFKTVFSVILAASAAAVPVQAHDRERDTLESAADAAGVAVIPNVVKVGFVFDGRFGRGVVLARRSDGGWSNPVFLTMAGGGVGWQAGVQSTDVILVFKTRESIDRLLRGKDKITLGGDVAVAAGPVGRQAEAETDARLRAEIFSYSRSRGLFAGVSLEGAALLVDHDANEAFYDLHDGRPADVLRLPASEAAEVCRLKDRLNRLAAPAASPPPPIIFSPEPPPAPMPPR